MGASPLNDPLPPSVSPPYMTICHPQRGVNPLCNIFVKNFWKNFWEKLETIFPHIGCQYICEEIILTIEESSHGDFRVFLDDMDKKDLIPSEFDGKTEDEITNSEFVDAVRDFYEATTREKR